MTHHTAHLKVGERYERFFEWMVKLGMDKFQKLLFPQAVARAETVTIDESFQAAISHQNLPLAVQRLAGEMAAAALLSAGALHYDGTVILQVAGDGPVRLMVVEVSPNLVYRVSVVMREQYDPIEENASMQSLLNVHGNAQCSFILDPANRPQGVEPYRGLVALEGETFADVMTNYFIHSEQVETLMVLACDERRAGGIMIQKMPTQGGKALPEDYDEDGWNRLKLFVNTVNSEELLTLSPEEINRRLFWEENPEVMYEEHPVFRCSCSDERLYSVIRSLGRDEVDSILEERDGNIEITCQFCGRVRLFTRDDVNEIFATDLLAPQAPQTLS